jgi:hypothetical protein
MKSLDSIFKIAEIHAKRLRFAMNYLKKKMPISAKDIENISDEDLPMFELYTSRFSKLQDFMGSSLFTAILETTGEQIEQMTFIDKLNKLEKLNLISSTQDWMSMRQIRNSLAHEYPEHPELTAKFFNDAYQLGTPLLETLEKLKNFINKCS